MADDLNLRLEKVEGTLGTVVVILEGEPILDIAGNQTGTTGGIVKQGEQHTEALYIIDRKLDGILAQLPHRWTRTQRISATGVGAAFLVAAYPVITWAF